LFVSQILTLYTTPVIYLLIDRLRRKLGSRGALAPMSASSPSALR
jgi:multidrug efflux pump